VEVQGHVCLPWPNGEREQHGAASPKYQVNLETMVRLAIKALDLNAIGVATLSTDKPIVFEPYENSRTLGGFILIDKITNATVGAGMLSFSFRRSQNVHWQAVEVSRCRWQVELFFKWIKQHLRIKAFFGTSETAVKTQIWIAISVYVLVAIVKKRLNLPRSLYETLQILSLTLCEQMPLDELLAQIDTDQNPTDTHNQMNLFD